MSLDPGTLTATTILAFDTTVLPSSLAPLGVDAVNNLLAAINFDVTPVRDTLNLYDIGRLSTTTLNMPLDSELFPVDNPNANGVGAVDFGQNIVFALDANNGLVAYSIVPEPSPITLVLIGSLGWVWALRRRS